MGSHSVRSAGSGDAQAITRLALDNGMFAPEELGTFTAMLDGYCAGELPEHRWVVATDGGRVLGAAYVAPEPFSDRMWNLYFIGVAPPEHGTGVGGALIRAVEDSLRGLGEPELVKVVEAGGS